MPRVVHFEIDAEKPERAIKFYEKVFGWKIEKWKGPMEYWLIMTGNEKEPGIDGGLSKRMEPLAGTGTRAYLCTIGVSSVDEYTKKIEKAGGEIVMPKMQLMGVGWFVQAKDTEGNLFSLMQEVKAAQ